VTVADVLDAAALAVTAMGFAAAVVVLAATRAPRTALAVLLEFLLAAGLLRLAGGSWAGLATAALILLVRRLAGAGLRTAADARAGSGLRAPGG